MTEEEFQRKLKTERLKGRYSVLVAIIGALAAMIAAVINLYQPLEKENAVLESTNSALEQEIVESQSEISQLKDRIAQLESAMQTRNSEASDESQTLQSRIDALQSENADLQARISTLQNTSPQSEQMPDVLESEGDAGTSSQQSSEGVDLLTVCPPYETLGYDAPEKLMLMGTKFENAFSLSCAYNGTAYAYFNLDNQYETMEFDVGHVDGSDTHSRVLTIYLNNEAMDPVQVQASMMKTHFTLPVSGILQVRIVLSCDHSEDWPHRYPQYGIVNAKLFS